MNSKSKLDSYQDGVCYLTSHRIIYVDNVNPIENSIEFGLHVIKEIESYVSVALILLLSIAKIA